MSVASSKHDEEEQREAERHDRLYAERRPANLRMDPSDWQKFDGMRSPIDAYAASIVELGDIHGRKVLDMGCGDGWLSIILAKRGGSIAGYDISAGAIETAKQRAVANDVAKSTEFKVASAYDTGYPDNYFDIAIGQAILHHLGDKRQLARELKRVLKPGAKAVFCEPFGAVAWLKAVRRVVPVANEAADDPDQAQLTYADFKDFDEFFRVELQEYQLFSRLDRIIRARGFVKFLGRVDKTLLQRLPFLRKYARTAVVILHSR